jgi:hypothetical protein
LFLEKPMDPTSVAISAGISLVGSVLSAGAADEFAAQASAAHAAAMGYAQDEIDEMSGISSKEEQRIEPFQQKVKDFVLGSGADPRVASEIKKQESANIRAITTQGAMGAIGAGDIARQAQYNAGNQTTQNAYQSNEQRMRMALSLGDNSNVLNLKTKAADRSTLVGLESKKSGMLYGQAASAGAAAAEGISNAATTIGSYKKA